jgi:hypothetical protein
MTEQLTLEPEQQKEHMPTVGDDVLVLRGDGRIDSMKIVEFSDPVETFDSHNQPITEREVTVVGREPEVIEGQLAYPQKTILEETLTPEAQRVLAEKQDAVERTINTLHQLGKVGLSKDPGSDVSVYHVPNMENKK